MKKLLSLALALVMIMSVVMVSAHAEGEKIVLNFWHSMSGTNGNSIDHMVEAFNASQDEIEVIATYQGNYWDSIANAVLAISQGIGPDLIQTGSGEARILTDEEGIAANLLDYLDDELPYEDFVPNFIDCYRYEMEGEDYLAALPMGCSTPVLYCNKTLLDENNLEIPHTWQELYDVCKVLVDNGIVDYGCGQGRDAWYLFGTVTGWGDKCELYAEDGLSLSEGAIANIKEAYPFLQDMIRHNYFYAAPATNGGTIMNEMMSTKKMAFYINSIGGLNTQETNAKTGEYELGVSNFPNYTVPSGGNSLVLLEGPNKDAAWKFIKWIYTSEDGLAYFDYYSGYVACNASSKATETLQKKINENPNYARAYDYLSNVNNNHLIRGNSQMSTTYLNFLDAVFYDLEDVEENLETLEEGVKEVLAEANGL